MRNIASFDIKKTQAIFFITVRKNLLIKLAEDNRLVSKVKKLSLILIL